MKLQNGKELQGCDDKPVQCSVSVLVGMCVADEANFLRLYSGLKVFNSTQLFPEVQVNANSLHILIHKNASIKYSSEP